MQAARSKPVEILGRLIAPLGRCLTTNSAKEILSLRAGASARRRLERLAAKCEAGRLTPEERAEYQLFVEVSDLVALLQAKARRHLAEHRDNSDQRVKLRAELKALGRWPAPS